MITKDKIKKIIKLAKFKMPGEEQLEIYANELPNIMNMLDIFKELDCTNTQPLTSVCEMSQKMRQDLVECEDISEQLFANLHEEKGNLTQTIKCYVVPKVVE